MRPAFLALVAALAVLPLGGCSLLRRDASTSAGPAAPVALVLEGSAVTQPEARTRIENVVRQVSGRPLLRAHALDTRSDPRPRIAARLAKDVPGMVGYDWREPRCAPEADVLVALATNTDAVYRVALDATTRTRARTETDRRTAGARPEALGKIVASVRAATAGREESVVGSVALSGFTRDRTSARVPVDRSASGRALTSRLLDPTAIAADALRGLPPTRTPEWEPYARRLIASGCPVLAMAVADARLGSGTTFRRVQGSAVEALRRFVERNPAPAVARAQPEAEPAGAAPRPAPEPPTCSALCTMHMIELCNNDLALWIEHRVRWEATACGRRRAEPFLTDCYDRQWTSGTFEEACVTPCETTPEGRTMLESILRRAGCLSE